MLLLLIAAMTTSAGQATPRAFLTQLYANYRSPDYSPFDHPQRVFAPRLNAAIEEDAKQNQGEVGYIDADPICQCQDADGLRASIISVREHGRRQADARVVLRFTGNGTHLPVHLFLTSTPDGWRVLDVSSRYEPSFLHGIEQSNRKARQSRRARRSH